MRIIVFFDLPTISVAQRRAYTKFRKQLIKEGFLMMQESVYTKLVINKQSLDLELRKIDSFLPKDGLIQALAVTEKQFSKIQTVLGSEKQHPEISSTDRLVVL